MSYPALCAEPVPEETSQIAITAFMAAVLYYPVFYASVHIEMKRVNLKVIPRSFIVNSLKALNLKPKKLGVISLSSLPLSSEWTRRAK